MKLSRFHARTARLRAELKQRTMLLAEGVRDLLFPAACFLCGSPPDFDGSLLSGCFCSACRGEVALTGPDACPRCGERGDRARRGACPRCAGRDLGFDRCAAGASYGGAVTELVHALKFSGDPRVAYPLGRLALRGALIALDGALPDAVTAVPLHPFKRIRRGYNQAELIGRVAARGLGVPFATSPVRRVRNTPSQGAGPVHRRRSNMKGAFRATGGSDASALRRLAAGVDRDAGRRTIHLLLVDDVLSTGATMSACARALGRTGLVRVTGAAAAT